MVYRLPAFKGGSKCPTVARPGGNKDSSTTNANQVSNFNKTRVQGQSLADRQRSESAQNNNNSLPNSTGTGKATLNIVNENVFSVESVPSM